jgi:hypothetical protein
MAGSTINNHRCALARKTEKKERNRPSVFSQSAIGVCPVQLRERRRDLRPHRGVVLHQRDVRRGVAAYKSFVESKFRKKPGSHISGSRVETRRCFQAMGPAGYG